MSNGAKSQNEVASSSDAIASGGGSSSPAPTPAPAPEIVEVDVEEKAVPMILPSSLCSTRTRGTCTSCQWFMCLSASLCWYRYRYICRRYLRPVLTVYAPKCVPAPVPVRHQYRYRTLWYAIHASTGQFGTFGTT